MKKQFKAWAIDLNSKEHHGFVGRYWQFIGDPKIPEKLEGCQTCLFTTRKIARKNLKKMKSKEYVAFPNARVKKVLVTIETGD